MDFGTVHTSCIEFMYVQQSCYVLSLRLYDSIWKADVRG